MFGIYPLFDENYKNNKKYDKSIDSVYDSDFWVKILDIRNFIKAVI